MTQLAEQLNKKLETWNPKVIGQAKQLVDDVITMPNTNALDLLPSRLAVLKVLDLLDERYARKIWLTHRPLRTGQSRTSVSIRLVNHSSSLAWTCSCIRHVSRLIPA